MNPFDHLEKHSVEKGAQQVPKSLRTAENHKGKVVFDKAKAYEDQIGVEALLRHKTAGGGVGATGWAFSSAAGRLFGIRDVSGPCELALIATGLLAPRHTGTMTVLVAATPLKFVFKRVGYASSRSRPIPCRYEIPSLQREAADRLDAVFGGHSATNAQP